MSVRYDGSERDDARDRLLMSIADACVYLVNGCGPTKTTAQLAHNLHGCEADLVKAAGINGQHSQWKDLVNER